jgi:hypothetical protein
LSKSKLPGVFALLSLGVATDLAIESWSTEAPGSPDWSLKGDGVVCCPCRVPCPCRNNGKPSYGHCEATLYLRIKQGYYKDVNLDHLQLVETGGMCATSYEKLSALYFDSSESTLRREAYMNLVASFSNTPVEFPHVRAVRLHSQVTDAHIFHVSIPDIVELTVDRNWGLPSPPMPLVAATDHFANTIQYAQNICYRMHDDKAGLNFDYSRRQANYRSVDLTSLEYQTMSMLVQFVDGNGWFSARQLELIRKQNLQLPELYKIRDTAIRLKSSQGAH